MKKLVGALSLIFLLLAAIVDASPITFAFNGVVSQGPFLDPDDPFGGTITFGTPFSGSYVFESATPDMDRSLNGGSYTSAGGCCRSPSAASLFRRRSVEHRRGRQLLRQRLLYGLCPEHEPGRIYSTSA